MCDGDLAKNAQLVSKIAPPLDYGALECFLPSIMSTYFADGLILAYGLSSVAASSDTEKTKTRPKQY